MAHSLHAVAEVIRKEEENGVRRVLYQYAISKRGKLAGKCYEEDVELHNTKVSWYHAGVKDSYLNSVVFLDPESVTWESIQYFANEFLPNSFEVSLYSLSFFAKERLTKDEEGKEVWEPTNEAIRKAQDLMCTEELNPHVNIKWKLSRCPIMVRTLHDAQEDTRTQFTPRPELEIVHLDPDLRAHIVAFEEICSSAFDYEYSEELVGLHTRISALDPAHRSDRFEKFLLRHISTGSFVGIVSYSIDDSSPNQIATLTELAVHSDHKRLGYGAYLVRYVINLLHNLKYTYLILDATSEGRLLYDKLGFVPLPNYAVYRMCSMT